MCWDSRCSRSWPRQTVRWHSGQSTPSGVTRGTRLGHADLAMRKSHRRSAGRRARYAIVAPVVNRDPQTHQDTGNSDRRKFPSHWINRRAFGLRPRLREACPTCVSSRVRTVIGIPERNSVVPRASQPPPVLGAGQSLFRKSGRLPAFRGVSRPAARTRTCQRPFGGRLFAGSISTTSAKTICAMCSQW